MALTINLPAAEPLAGVDLYTGSAGIKVNGADDLVIIGLAEGANCSAVFTQNSFAAAPVQLCREHLSKNAGAVRALLINAGNANAGTGQPGLDMARAHCAAVAEILGVSATSVLPFSTGVIGQLLPDESMRSAIGSLLSGAHSNADSDLADKSSGVGAWHAASKAIMTTDTQPKLTSRDLQLGEQPVTITGMAKGAGMIQPDMATLLSYVFTDADIAASDLDRALLQAVALSFNSITVDSDTSTNDSCVLVATGKGPQLDAESEHWPVFIQQLNAVFLDLAQAIVRDAEGASKFITVHVSAGQSVTECRAVAYAIANSPLVKSALYASDANVGRLLMAIGKAGLPDLDASRVKVSLGDVRVFEAGGISPGYTEERGAAAVASECIDICVELGRGVSSATVYTSDLSHEYVSINADYRS